MRKISEHPSHPGLQPANELTRMITQRQQLLPQIGKMVFDSIKSKKKSPIAASEKGLKITEQLESSIKRLQILRRGAEYKEELFKIEETRTKVEAGPWTHKQKILHALHSEYIELEALPRTDHDLNTAKEQVESERNTRLTSKKESDIKKTIEQAGELLTDEVQLSGDKKLSGMKARLFSLLSNGNYSKQQLGYILYHEELDGILVNKEQILNSRVNALMNHLNKSLEDTEYNLDHIQNPDNKEEIVYRIIEGPVERKTTSKNVFYLPNQKPFQGQQAQLLQILSEGNFTASQIIEKIFPGVDYKSAYTSFNSVITKTRERIRKTASGYDIPPSSNSIEFGKRKRGNEGEYMLIYPYGFTRRNFSVLATELSRRANEINLLYGESTEFSLMQETLNSEIQAPAEQTIQRSSRRKIDTLNEEREEVIAKIETLIKDQNVKTTLECILKNTPEFGKLLSSIIQINKASLQQSEGKRSLIDILKEKPKPYGFKIDEDSGIVDPNRKN